MVVFTQWGIWIRRPICFIFSLFPSQNFLEQNSDSQKSPTAFELIVIVECSNEVKWPSHFLIIKIMIWNEFRIQWTNGMVFIVPLLLWIAVLKPRVGGSTYNNLRLLYFGTMLTKLSIIMVPTKFYKSEMNLCLAASG